MTAAAVLTARSAGVPGAEIKQSEPEPTADPYLWLEEVHGERALEWVREENAKTIAVLEKDPRFPGIRSEALRMAQAEDRIPYANFTGGALYNFWQDSAHVRGVWRRTSLESYRTKNPVWTTVLDLDSLAAAEKANWVWAGSQCEMARERRSLISLSDGGEDASSIREFDLITRAFVPGGFFLPKGKQNAAWVGEDTLLASREWNTGEVTESGYPFIVKRLVRGQSLDDAVEIFRGDAKDMGVFPFTMMDGQNRRVSMIVRSVTFFENEYAIVRRGGVTWLGLPKKSEVQEFFEGQIIVRLTQDWVMGGRTFRSGSLVSFDAEASVKNPEAIAPVLIFEPGPRETVSGVYTTADRVIVAIYQNVQGRILVFRRSAGDRWTANRLPLPDNLSTSVRSTEAKGSRFLISVTGFLTPSSVWLGDAGTETAVPIKTLPPRFDASACAVEQFEAVSTDGTKIPYFIVRPKGMKPDGNNPTILYAYGGFEVAITPSYNENAGRLWLERGGVYVIANIRGGGEFGPAWHEAGLKTRRQIVFDDFTAVAQDLIRRGFTTPRRLGIMGGSNGGLLMGVQMTQHPELWNAVDIQVPLLDMLRYEQIAAGASWVGEYGSVSIPEERAFLASISPLHNLKPGVRYPMPLIWTTIKDDRVGPQHARKFAAKMADMKLPYLYYEVVEGGHGSGANIEQRTHTTALEYIYFIRQLMD
ncbi:S9 family peptidase [bacterium]|nr:S9 family peptidase [bacterium]